MSASGGILDMVRRANRTRAPEDSIALRAAILATVLMGVLALAVERAISPPIAVVVALSLAFAYWLSYVRRDKDNWHLKILISILAIVALFRFFGQLRTIATLDEVRFPLADLFLWVQVLHGFDLPARKDLNFSLGSSLTLMAVAASLSQDFWYAPVLALYFVCATGALIFSHRSEIRAGAQPMQLRGREGEKRRGPLPRRDIVKGLAVSLVAGTVLFLVIPQPTGVRTFALPFALGNGAGLASGSGVANPGFEEGTGLAGSRSIGSAFYGFDDNLNLRVRGGLNDDVVIRVRASGPAMWRGLLFAEYDGVQWKGDQAEPTPLAGDPPLYYPSELRSIGPRQTISATFYIEREQPSVVFTGGQPETIWTEERVSVDRVGGLRLDATLTEGAVYSAVSSVGAATPDELRALPAVSPEVFPNHPDTPERDFDKYLQLPQIPQRVHDLARRITADAPTQYDKVRAIETWLAENYRYSVDSPVPPLGQDAVDHFLFETDVGFCEQFASATIVMLRSIGIPARMVAGYAVGTRNPFTGYYELKNSDAHTWVDVWFPKMGWYEFDPTFAIPPAEEDLASSVPLMRALQSATKFFGEGTTKDLNRYVRYGLVAMLVGVLVIGGWMLWKRVARRRVPIVVPDLVTGGPVTHAFRRYENALAARGSPRAPPETAAELVARTAPKRPRIPSALEAFQRERYGAEPPKHEEVEEAVAELDALAAETASGGRREPHDITS